MLSPQIKGKGLHLQFIKHNFTFASSTLEINSSLDYLCLFICKGSHFCHQGQVKPPNEECPGQLFLNMFASESHYIKERYHPACTHTRKEKEKNKQTNKPFLSQCKLHTVLRACQQKTLIALLLFEFRLTLTFNHITCSLPKQIQRSKRAA